MYSVDVSCYGMLSLCWVTFLSNWFLNQVLVFFSRIFFFLLDFSLWSSRLSYFLPRYNQQGLWCLIKRGRGIIRTLTYFVFSYLLFSLKLLIKYLKSASCYRLCNFHRGHQCLLFFFDSLSLLGVILIAFQQAQYILAEFMKSRQRPNPSSSSQQNSNSVDVISSDSYK